LLSRRNVTLLGLIPFTDAMEFTLDDVASDFAALRFKEITPVSRSKVIKMNAPIATQMDFLFIQRFGIAS
jgi:hypothetical protein